VIVLDSSAAVDYLLRLEPRATWVETQLDQTGWEVHVPHVFDVEVVGVLRRLVLLYVISDVLAAEVLTDLADLDVHRYSQVDLFERAWELRRIVTTSDAMFVALAERLEAPLVTTDRSLGRVHDLRIPILAP
jgi:predicted nucleic acid-binding protein